MKKFVVSLIAVFTLCLAAAVAQTATDPSQAAPGTSPSASQPGSASQQPGQANNSSAAATEKSEKKLRGCIQSEGGKYVLESKKGKATPLAGQDVSAHVGHEVSLKGSWESGGAGTGVSSGASAEKAFNVTSVDMISDTCGAKSSKDGNSGSMGTTPSGSSPAGTGSTTNPPQ